MAYMALYRQWRPHTFEGVVGQIGAVKTLQNQVITGRIGHAYLFCGSRGTGKTSTAQIFSRAINCIDNQNGSPCGVCRVCTGLADNSNMDIIEIDAASNNGVDEIRDIREKVNYPPAVGKYRVYIVDEVHMLSTGAFNALLKTLEEPPSHAVFILATTEPHKLPDTVISRCQRIDFKRVDTRAMVKLMSEIAVKAEIKVDKEALMLIARWSEGGMRDALGLLDKCAGFTDNDITADLVTSIIGTVSRRFLFLMADMAAQNNAAGILDMMAGLVEEGRDLRVFSKDMAGHFRNLMLSKVTKNPANILDYGDDTINQYITQAKELSLTRIIRAIEIISALDAKLRYSNQPRILVELAFVKICRPEMENDFDSLLDRIETLEIKLESGMQPLQKVEQMPPPMEEAPQELEDVSIYDSDIEDDLPWRDTPVTNSKPMLVAEDKTAEIIEPELTETASVEKKVSTAIETEPENKLSDERLETIWNSTKKMLQKSDPALGKTLELLTMKPIEHGIELIMPKDKVFWLTVLKRDNNKNLIRNKIWEIAGREIEVDVHIETDGEKENSGDSQFDRNVLRISDLISKDKIEFE